MKNYCFFFCLFISSITSAKMLYNCTNVITEAQCNNNMCQLQKTTNTKPTQIRVFQNNIVSICTDSNCWSTKVKPILSNNNVIYSSDFFQTQDKQNTTSFILNIRPKTSLGFLQGDQILLPLQCK